MPMFDETPLGRPPALVTRHAGGSGDSPRYLLIRPQGSAVWVEDPEAATAFDSMHEATRFATRLPARLRAFGMPRGPEVALHHPH
jgi:hypothetical protein